MDVYSFLNGQRFVWNSEKAASNLRQHGVSFDTAREAFFDTDAIYEDASPPHETRHACIGFSSNDKLLFVVHVEQQGDMLRLISARVAESAERNRYDDENE